MDQGVMSGRVRTGIQEFWPEVSSPFLRAVLSREDLYSKRGPTFYNFALKETKSGGRGPRYWLSITA